MGETKHTIIRFPKDLLQEIDALVGDRERSRFIIEASRERLLRMKQGKALANAAGAWKNHDLSGLVTHEDMEEYITGLRRTSKRNISPEEPGEKM